MDKASECIELNIAYSEAVCVEVVWYCSDGSFWFVSDAHFVFEP